jgi:hypothetical protein
MSVVRVSREAAKEACLLEDVPLIVRNVMFFEKLQVLLRERLLPMMLFLLGDIRVDSRGA